MKKVININFQGRVIPIEETAYDMLQQYVESLRNFFANEEGRDEIINDIEGRIAELFAETLKKGGTCITDLDVQAIINSIGRPEELDADEPVVEKNTAKNSSQSYGPSVTIAANKKLYRSENDKIIAGVCSGIGHYFGIDPLIVRILFVIAAFAGGSGILIYILLWIAVPSTATQVIGSARKRLFRSPDDKIIAGVCSGIGYYFGINAWIPRVLFLIPFLSIAFGWSSWGDFGFPHFLNISFSPGATILYIVLWIVLPEAKTTSDKLEMKGEKVDLNSIKNIVTDDLKGVNERVAKLGKEASDYAREKSRMFGNRSTGLGDVITVIVKAFAYFILAIVAFALTAALFGMGVVATGLLPIKDYVIEEGWQNVFAWGTLILGIWVPVIALITFIIRRIARIRSNNHFVRYTFLALWLIGIACTAGLIVSTVKSFKARNIPAEETVALVNDTINKLEVTSNGNLKYYGSERWLKLEPFASFDEDTVFVRNVRVRITKSATPSYQVKMLKLANGNTKQKANDIVSKMNFSIVQVDSTLQLDKGIAITKDQKFRNQRVIVTIAVPVGKRIIVNENVGFRNEVHLGDDDNFDFTYKNQDDEEDYNHGVEYIMTEDGLQRADGRLDEDYDGYRKDKTLEQYQESREQLRREIEERERELEMRKKELERAGTDTSETKKTNRYRYSSSFNGYNRWQQKVEDELKQIMEASLKSIKPSKPIVPASAGLEFSPKPAAALFSLYSFI